MLGVGGLDQVDMVRKFGELAIAALRPHALRRPVRRDGAGPVRPEAELAVLVREAVDEMRGLEIGLHVDPFLLLEAREIAEPALAQHDVDMLLLGQPEARHVSDAETLGQFLDDEMVGARPFGRIDQLRPQDDVLVAAAAIDVVVLEEHGGRQHDVGEPAPCRS